jgi:hypothetical protein
MSASSPPGAAVSSSSQQQGTKILTAKSFSDSNSDWLANSLVAAKTITAAAECAPFPYIKGVFATAVILLETVEVQHFSAYSPWRI